MAEQTGKEMVVSGEQTRQNELYAIPPVDIYEKDGVITVLADLPGVRPDGLSINLDNHVLTIEGKTAMETGDFLLKEYDLTSFYRQFRVTEEINQDAIRAVLKNGVLTLTMPLRAKPKPFQIKVEN